jgi:hypothetical protein
MSRPSASVPNQCAADGGCSAAAESDANGSYGTIDGPISAPTTSASSNAAASSVSGFSPST